MKTTVGEAAKVAEAANTLIQLLGKDAPNGAVFSQYTIRTAVEKITNGDGSFVKIGDALTDICNFCIRLNKVELNIK